MDKIKITEDELKQIVNESVKRVLSEGWGAGIRAGLNKFNSTADKNMGLSNRVTQSINAANMGSKFEKAYNMCFDLGISIQELGQSGFMTKQEVNNLNKSINEIMEFLRNKRNELGLNTY